LSGKKRRRQLNGGKKRLGPHVTQRSRISGSPKEKKFVKVTKGRGSSKRKRIVLPREGGERKVSFAALQRGVGPWSEGTVFRQKGSVAKGKPLAGRGRRDRKRTSFVKPPGLAKEKKALNSTWEGKLKKENGSASSAPPKGLPRKGHRRKRREPVGREGDRGPSR